MTSTVTVFETTARRTVIKVSPAKYLHEVRAEACARFNLSPDRYGLKHNNKTLDLSTAFRQTGLAAGARLELTLLSRSAGVVNVALQLPADEAAESSNGRLVDKFPSTTTLWQILRRFEDGVAGSDTRRNLTARSIPLVDGKAHGAGRLYYERPVLVIMHKELSTFVDLQKTLSTLGLNNGSVLIKLEFKPSDQPFEDAQQQIEHYFHQTEGIDRDLQLPDLDQPPVQNLSVSQISTTSTVQASSEAPLSDPSSSHDIEDNEVNPLSTSQAVEELTCPPIGTDRPTTVFSAPLDSQPKAATIVHHDADYDYTVEHAQLQHAQYKSAGRNKPLPSDAQIDAKRTEIAVKLASVTSVKIRTRFPDNTQALAAFDQQDTSRDLYAHIRKLLRHEDAPFSLRFRGSKGMFDLPDEDKRLIQDLGMTGDATVFLTWGENASINVRKAPTLKAEVAANAQELHVQLLTELRDPIDSSASHTQPANVKAEKSSRGMPAWLKKTLPGAKK